MLKVWYCDQTGIFIGPCASDASHSEFLLVRNDSKAGALTYVHIQDIWKTEWVDISEKEKILIPIYNETWKT